MRIAIDDFGTGYSSLAVLKRFPVDCLKVDRSFVRDIPNDADDMAITALDHRAGAQHGPVGGGRRRRDRAPSASSWCECGCDEMQGFLFSKPLPADELAERVLGHIKTALAA